MRQPVLTGGDWEGQGWEVGVRTKGPAHRPRWPPRTQATAVILCSGCRRKGEEKRAGRVGPRRRLSPLPLRTGSPARDAAEPGGQPQPSPWPSRGRRRQSPSGQGRDPGQPIQVSVHGEGGGRKGGPGPPKSRYWSGAELVGGRGRTRARKRRRTPATLREWSPCALSTSPGNPHTSSASNLQTALPAFPSGRKLAPRRRQNPTALGRRLGGRTACSGTEFWECVWGGYGAPPS